MKVWFNDEQHDVYFSEYNSGKICITLIGSYSLKKTVATVDDYSFSGKDNVIIKNYSENQGVEEALIYGGVISKQPKEIIPGFGAINLKVFALTPKALGCIKFQKKLNKFDSIAI